MANEFKPTFQEPNIEHLMPVPPATVMQHWAEQRLEARGVNNVAKFTIVDAQVKATPLKVDTGITGAFKLQQAVRYDASVAGMLEIVDDRGFRRAFASARVSRSRTLPEDASLNEREKVWFELTEALMRDFDAEMEQNIRAHVGGFVM